MQKIYEVKGIDCANCAAKIEKNINKIKTVNSAIVSFATGKMMIDIDDDKFDQTMDEVVSLVNDLEPDWEIVK